MSDIQRYDQRITSLGCSMEKSHDGDWVDFDEHLELVDALRHTVLTIQTNATYVANVENMERLYTRIAELEADNATMQRQLPRDTNDD